MQETIERENMVILFLEVLGLSISQATEIISWVLGSCEKSFFLKKIC